MTCQDPYAYNSAIFQMTDCIIQVPVVKLTDNLKEKKREKIASDKGICYSLTNQYYRTFYIYPNDTVLINNITQGYKPKYMFIYWVDYTHQSNGDTNINNYILEKPNLRNLEIWCDGMELKKYEPRKNQVSIDWDAIYQDFMEWTGRTINTKQVWMNGKTIIPVKVDPSPDQQVKDPDMYTLHDTCDISIKQVFNGKPYKRQLRLFVQWLQSERLIINKTGIITKSLTQNT